MARNEEPETTSTPEFTAAPPSGQAGGGRPQVNQPQVKLDSSTLKSSYCNVCNATSTREEVVLNFGINSNWDQGGQNFDVQLHHRIILSPFAAKRVSDLLNKLVQEHETRYGELK